MDYIYKDNVFKEMSARVMDVVLFDSKKLKTGYESVMPTVSKLSPEEVTRLKETFSGVVEILDVQHNFYGSKVKWKLLPGALSLNQQAPEKRYKKGHYTLVFSDGEKPDLEVAYNMTREEVRTVFKKLCDESRKVAYLYYQVGEGDMLILMTDNEVRELLDEL